jgi:signal transduction histidine kinase
MSRFTAQKALGLGCLPLVKGIMEQHLGGIEINSRVGTGTKAALWLPIKKGN